MAKAVVKWFSPQKGWGFLVDSELSDKDIFVHYSAISMEGFKTLKEGDEVDYDLISSDRGPQASNVKLSQKVK
jgi:CspA family cold shock protein